MANKNFWLGILVMVLVFGMAVVGCDDEDGGIDSALNGTWVNEDGAGFKLDNGNFESFVEGGTPTAKGTYTTSGGKLTMTNTHRNDGDDSVVKWKTKAQMLENVNDEDKKALIEGMFGSVTYSYSVSDNKLTVTFGAGSMTLTRK